MQIPYRKPGKYMTQKTDPCITQEKFNELNEKLKKLKETKTKAASEVSRLAELGDFSENVEYQLAKGKLRGINTKIMQIEYTLKTAEIIKPNANNNTVQIGHTVTIKNNDKTKTYQILGSAEANPSVGTISQGSPIGSALMGKKIGSTIKINLSGKETEYKILNIE